MDFNGKKELVKQVQTALGLSDDGVDGPKTWKAIAEKLCPATVVPETQIVTDTQSALSPSSLKLIIDYEVGGGQGYYNAALKNPCYPGGQSGVTIGIGYDLGYNTASQFKADWGSYIDGSDYNRLAQHLGKKGSSAKAAIPSVRDIVIPWDEALEVFKKNTIPRFIKETLRAFPGADKLHPNTFGALVSLVFNRGGSLSGNSRVEMLNISKAIKGEIQTANIYGYIADQIISMKRLWVGKGLDGLLRRRNEEAAMVRKSK
jgi:GH24 family phage-related lysozyme (muramidase)